MSESVEYWVDDHGSVRVYVAFYDDEGEIKAEAGSPAVDPEAIITIDDVVQIVVGDITAARQAWDVMEAGKVTGAEEDAAKRLIQMKELQSSA